MHVTDAENDHENDHENHNGRYTFAPECGPPHRFWTDFPGEEVICHEPNGCAVARNSRNGAETLARLTVAAPVSVLSSTIDPHHSQQLGLRLDGLREV